MPQVSEAMASFERWLWWGGSGPNEAPGHCVPPLPRVANDMLLFLSCCYHMQVGEAMASFEQQLWSLARDYHAVAQRQPRRLVDVARVVEMQQQVGRPLFYRHCIML
jgi:hypothetical protein